MASSTSETSNKLLKEMRELLGDDYGSGVLGKENASHNEISASGIDAGKGRKSDRLYENSSVDIASASGRPDASHAADHSTTARTSMAITNAVNGSSSNALQGNAAGSRFAAGSALGGYSAADGSALGVSAADFSTVTVDPATPLERRPREAALQPPSRQHLIREEILNRKVAVVIQGRPAKDLLNPKSIEAIAIAHAAIYFQALGLRGPFATVEQNTLGGRPTMVESVRELPAPASVEQDLTNGINRQQSDFDLTA
jgi:hypothetical protein